MKFALEVWSSDWEEIERTCQVAERLGYDAFYYGESPTGLNLDCWTVLAALAHSTRTIRLGPVIANVLPAYRSPLLLAKQAATVALVSGGRLDFRTGAGASKRYADPWWEPFGIEYPRYDARLRLLETAIPLLRSLWAGGFVSLADGDVSLGFAVPAIPITLAAVGPSGLACAAQHADVWEASYRTAGEFRELSARLATLPGAASRRIERSLEADVFVGRTDEEVGSVLRDLERERGAGESQRVIERSLHGTPRQVSTQLQKLRSAGAEQLVLAFHDPHDVAALEAFAESIAAFRESKAS